MTHCDHPSYHVGFSTILFGQAAWGCFKCMTALDDTYFTDLNKVASMIESRMYLGSALDEAVVQGKPLPFTVRNIPLVAFEPAEVVVVDDDDVRMGEAHPEGS